jgi:hypothetical protein
MPSSPSRLRIIKRALLLLAMALFCALAWQLWHHAPRRFRDPAFVRIGPEGDFVNLPIEDFRCEVSGPSLRTCQAQVEEHVLIVTYDLARAGCQARFLGKAAACTHGVVLRSRVQPALLLHDSLGTSAARRQRLRRLDPLSHMSESDFGLPQGLFALLVGALCLRGVYRFLSEVRPFIRVPLALLAFALSVPWAFVASYLVLCWLGYAD